MEQNNERFNYLLKKYLNKDCTAQEFEEFFTYVADPAYEEILHAQMNHNFKSLNPGADVHQVDWDNMYQNVIHHRGKTKIKSLFGKWVGIAASIALIATIAGGYWWLKTDRHTSAVMLVKRHDVKPGGDKAILTLADGSKITLDNSVKGTLTHQGNTAIKQNSSGMLVYDTNAAPGSPMETAYTNTLTTPAGGKFMLVLPDHSKVWLNSQSSISYVTAFKGRERTVELKGEAYFEISKDPERPFIVKSGRASVKVLGTHFNVSAYPDERLTEVVLSEGSVRLTVGTEMAQLKPGQQASFGKHDDAISLKEVDVDEAVDWKNGYFQFDNAEIEKVMNKLKRWYDIDIQYQGIKPGVKFTGIISRDNNLSKILGLLETSGGVSFQITDRTVIVKKH